MRSMVLLLFVSARFTQSRQPGLNHVRSTGHITLHEAAEEVFPLFGWMDRAKTGRRIASND
jgi:hypothetical protein